MSRIHNFSAGPGVMPESVLREAQDALWDLNGSGVGLVEHSHRGKPFDAVFQSAKARIRALLQLSVDQEVLFLHGGARSQFYMVPMNLLRGRTAAYMDTGVWSKSAIEDAKRYGNVDVVFSSRDARWDAVPAPGAWRPLAPDTAYLHYTSNNTVAGTEYGYIPDSGDVPLICDMSSNILSRPIDGARFGLIYAGAQKNMGPSGVTLVVIHKRLLEGAADDLPGMLRYSEQIKSDSMLNTPCTFAIWAIERVCAWIEREGGLAEMERRAIARSSLLYDVIDRSAMYRGLVQRDSRSRMNVTFTTGDAERDLRFARAAEAEGLSGLKGHRSVGGLRASLYNAQSESAVSALVAFMAHFEQHE